MICILIRLFLLSKYSEWQFMCRMWNSIYYGGFCEWVKRLWCVRTMWFVASSRINSSFEENKICVIISFPFIKRILFSLCGSSQHGRNNLVFLLFGTVYIVCVQDFGLFWPPLPPCVHRVCIWMTPPFAHVLPKLTLPVLNKFLYSTL